MLMIMKLTLSLGILIIVFSNYQCSLIKSAVFTVNSEYKSDEVTTVVWWSADTDMVTEFLKSYHGVVYTISLHDDIVKNNDTFNWYKGFQQAVFIANSVFEFEYFITNLNRHIVIPIKLILVVANVNISVPDVTTVAWENDLTDIVTIIEDDNGNVTFNTYFPYNASSCGSDTPIRLNQNADLMFPRKFKNLYGCPIKVLIFQYPPYATLLKDNTTIISIGGIDGDIFKLIADQLNSSMDVIERESTKGLGSFINGNATGSFRDLLKRKVDILIPAGFDTSSRHGLIQMSPIFKTLSIYWCAPIRREIYVWARILTHFFSTTAPYFVFTFIGFSIVITIFKKLVQHLSLSRESALFQTFRIFLGQEVVFVTDASIINSLYIMWIWFCLIVRIVYQGDLVEGLHKKYLEAPMTSLGDAINQVEGFGGVPSISEFYQDTKLGAKYEVLDLRDIPDYINKVADGKRFLLASDILTVQYLHRVVQVLEKPIIQAGTSYFMRPGWGTAKEVNLILQRVIESGFVEKVFDNYSYEWKKTNEAAKEKQHYRPIDILMLSACFYGLYVLWIVCFVIFIVEIVYFKVKQKFVK